MRTSNFFYNFLELIIIYKYSFTQKLLMSCGIFEKFLWVMVGFLWQGNDFEVQKIFTFDNIKDLVRKKHDLQQNITLQIVVFLLQNRLYKRAFCKANNRSLECYFLLCIFYLSILFFTKQN
eukprot:TRINITY_DN72979_c0_g1_i1.p4 TRINITY_DN72979_c0_g1~~TRINITY_DN72979_c0_g1_i1.p4  ORF type:complete len:121 (-),score=0.28 TRINITY_DN72979_c0_g1_i1:91-453(-)